MTNEDISFDATIETLIDADIPRAELGTILTGIGAKAAQPVVEKGLKKLSERTLETVVTAVRSGKVNEEDGYQALGWRLRILNHTITSYAVDQIAIASGRNATVTTDSGMGWAHPDSRVGKTILCPAEGSCEFWLETELGRVSEAVAVAVRLRALEGNRRHEFKLNLNRPDGLGLKIVQKT